MTDEEKAIVIEQAAALEARQGEADDPELLPKVGLEDVNEELKIPESRVENVKDLQTTWFARGTNGMVYETIVIDLPDLEPELLEVLPLFSDCITEMGCGDKDYRKTAARQAAVTGGISAKVSLRGNLSSVQTVQAVFSLGGKALERNQSELAEVLRETLEEVRFDELPHLRELIAQVRASNDNSITSRGHSLVMSASSSGMSPVAAYNHSWHGLAGIKFIKTLDDSLEKAEGLQAFASKLERIRDKLKQAPRQLLVVSEAEHHDKIANALANLEWQQVSEQETFNPEPVNKLIKQAWATHTQVNFSAKAYVTVPAGHADAPILTVLGPFLQNGYLHKAIREQGGAYGGGANYAGSTGSFRFFSYRDPRLMETLNDFDNSLKWLQESNHEPRALEEAILGVVSRIDRPGSPAGEAISAFFNNLHGRTAEQRRAFRSQVLQVTIADLQRVAKTYLQPEKAHIAVLSNAETLDGLSEELGLERFSV